jgi:hypothetical protein
MFINESPGVRACIAMTAAMQVVNTRVVRCLFEPTPYRRAHARFAVPLLRWCSAFWSGGEKPHRDVVCAHHKTRHGARTEAGRQGNVQLTRVAPVPRRPA